MRSPLFVVIRLGLFSGTRALTSDACAARRARSAHSGRWFREGEGTWSSFAEDQEAAIFDCRQVDGGYGGRDRTTCHWRRLGVCGFSLVLAAQLAVSI